MTDLVDWYNDAEQSGSYTPIELAAMFHYRYIRIHPFEDGNGRIARLLVNYILTRHGFPMIVVRSRKKNEYLEALHKTDLTVGATPSLGAHASKRDIQQFLTYFTNLFVEKSHITFVFLQSVAKMYGGLMGSALNSVRPRRARFLILCTQLLTSQFSPCQRRWE